MRQSSIIARVASASEASSHRATLARLLEDDLQAISDRSASTGYSIKIFVDHRQSAADKVAVAVGQVAVVALDQGVEAEAAVLAEGNFAEQEVAEDVGGEEVLFVFPVLVAQNCAGPIDGLWLERAEGVEDGFGADDVAVGLRHLRSSKRSQPWAVTALGKRQVGGEEEGGPVDAVLAGDLFAHDVKVGGPVFFELFLPCGVVAAVAYGGHVVGEGVEPDVDDVLLFGLEAAGSGTGMPQVKLERETERSWRLPGT